jgi:adenylate cyclase
MKKLNRFTSLVLTTYALGLMVTFAVTYAAVDFYSHPGEQDRRSLRGLIRMIHEKTVDFRMMDRGPAKGSDQVVILAIDDETLRLEGRWPWPREKTARLVDRTMMYGAKSVSFDMIFSETDNNSALPMVTRLEKIARNAKGSDRKLVEALAEEAAHADADKIFANTISANQDSLVMGGFFLNEMSVRKESELCLDGYYDQLYASKYWAKEAIPLRVRDIPLSDLKYPRQIRDHLPAYFLQLEREAANQWFEKNQQAVPRLRKALAEYAELNDPELFPGLSVLVANSDFESGLALLEQMPELHNIETLRTIYAKFASALDSKETASLNGSIRDASLSYCERFFSSRDELSSVEEFKKRWGSSPEALESFNALSWETFWKQLPAQPGETSETAKQAIERISKALEANTLPQTFRWELNIPTLADATKHTGFFNAVQDLDGSIRRARLMNRFSNNYAPSLAFKTFLLNNSTQNEVVVDTDKSGDEDEPSKVITSLKTFSGGKDQPQTTLPIPVDGAGHMLINYSGPQHMFPHIRATDLLSDTDSMTITEHVQDAKTGTWADVSRQVNKRQFLKDKIVFFGVTAIGVFDLRVTPFDGNFPGVETHANTLSNLLIESARARGEKVDPKAPGFLQTTPYEERLMPILLVVLGFVLAGMISYYPSVAGLFITLGTLFTVYVVDKYYLFQEGILVASMFPVTLIILEFMTLTFYKYFTEERTRRELKGTFEKYVSPAIVNEVLADPENIELGGKKMNLTVMFSDVRGFTTISEKLDPRQLSDLLNSYLTPMTNLVFAHKGTLDKYMGDAIMAFWGAPVHFPDHAVHACRCALKMLLKLKELQAEYRAKGLPEIDIGIGLNTGEMSVGNMGSDTVRSYTVMGDAVNLGSRLEGINKTYGTRIIISEFTYREVSKRFVCREIDWVTVKGKNIPVKIYELVAEGKVPDEQAVLLRNFEEGFKLYHEQRFGDALAFFQRALQVDANDAPSQLYLERCEDYLKNPPPPDWDGVFEMKTK